MQPPVGREQVGGRERHRLALEVGDFPARLLDDHRERGDVEDVEVGLDHRVDLAGSEQVVVQEVAVATDAAKLRDDPAVAAPGLAQRQRLEVARRQRSLRQVGNAAHCERPAVEAGATAAFGPGQLAVDRRARDAEHQLAALQQRDLRREHGVLAHERLGAVNRVDQPDELGIERARAGLLAMEAVMREALLQHGADRALGCNIRIGDRRLVRLHCDAQVAAIHAADHLGRGGGRLEGRIEKG